MGTQTQIQTVETKPKRRAHVQMFIDPPLYKLMQACARQEGLAVTSWIRQNCVKELRRRRKPSP